LQNGWKKLAMMTVFGAVLAVANYLKQSPLPMEDDK
jgi:hypothetical protein